MIIHALQGMMESGMMRVITRTIITDHKDPILLHGEAVHTTALDRVDTATTLPRVMRVAPRAMARCHVARLSRIKVGDMG
jgi:hypothetical protein